MEIDIFWFSALSKVSLTFPENFKTRIVAVLEINLPGVIDIRKYNEKLDC